MTMRRLLPLLLVATFSVTGCGPGQNSFNGTVAGSSLAVQRARWSNPGSGASSISVTFSTSADVCELLEVKVETVPAFFFILEGTAPGSYPVIANEAYAHGTGGDRLGRAWGVFHSADGPPAYMTEGAFKLDAVVQGASPVVQGSFDASFGPDRATGTFEATPCPR
jgi:hypothetical protein